MEFADKLREFAARVKNLKSKIKTEEATKTSMVMPFFSLLGYDVFNPLEFVPEYTADVGIKKGEKVDYAIVDKKQNPVILIEAKHCGEDLSKHGSQLFRYFATTSAKIGILTNGLVYQFYTDLDEQNKMDKKPFLVVNLLALKDSIIPYLQKFEKPSFNLGSVTAQANELRYSDQIRQFLSKQIDAPDDGFINYVISDIYKGRKTQRVTEDFRPLVKRAFSQLINDKANERIKTALDSEMASENVAPAAESTVVRDSVEVKQADKTPESFYVVKVLVHECLSDHNLTPKGDDTNLEILLDDNPDKWLCRLDCEQNYLYINLPSGDKEYLKRKIRSADDVYFYRELLCQAVQKNIDQTIAGG